MRSSPDAKLDEPNPLMSALQSIVIIDALIDQKLINPDYQAPPANGNAISIRG